MEFFGLIQGHDIAAEQDRLLHLLQKCAVIKATVNPSRQTILQSHVEEYPIVPGLYESCLDTEAVKVSVHVLKAGGSRLKSNLSEAENDSPTLKKACLRQRLQVLDYGSKQVTSPVRLAFLNHRDVVSHHG